MCYCVAVLPWRGYVSITTGDECSTFDYAATNVLLRGCATVACPIETTCMYKIDAAGVWVCVSSLAIAL